MTYAVIGGGNTGQAIAGYLTLQGEKVRLYTRDVKKAQRISRDGLVVTGIYTGLAELEVSTSMEQVLGEAETIIVSTTADGHKPVIKEMQPYLAPHQTLVFIPGYWGAVECKQILGNDIEMKQLTIAETSAQPFISLADQDGGVEIKKIKSNVLISTLSTSHGQPELPVAFWQRFPHLVPSKNVFETSFNNTNVVVHVPIAVFNASRIDDSKAFRFYPDGVSPLTVRYIEKVDEERRQVAELFDVDTQDILSILNQFYGTDYEDLYKALPGLFPEGNGPTTLDHRYFTEDIPYGLVAISEIAKKAGVDIPYIDSLIDITCLLSTVDYRKEGVNLENITFEELSSYGGAEKLIN
ncbi:NAD/NADP octopine/nopaline dehydrogenase family protein [Planococcus maritimus]|uniref:NAD/NADP octopine/nopaline dehydrogenase family protein n=1 Tax=Planococcus maritimus TaxID=192421 RepID=A0A7D7MFY2_PLAMR|nr:NAD/NADP-dependent octopine/nopaline dehydrogenase family protein [Planococcus maritimus]QMT16751.1 NAD/NADP octopine/nopaline dehydrogenase family protein [Planococcus maritimus]